MRRVIQLFLIAVTLTGCLSVYKVPENVPSADMVLAVLNDSTATTVRGTYFNSFENQQCGLSPYGIRTASTLKNDSSTMTEPKRIVADREFVFTAVYIDARAAQNRRCSITAAFNPKSNHHYKAMMVVKDNVSACDIGVYDTTSGNDEQIEFYMPKFVCADNGKPSEPNGRPLWTDWKVRVEFLPSGK